ncbi:MAG: FAD-binding oxidoreductase [Candidatus Helarchaeota archaeon]
MNTDELIKGLNAICADVEINETKLEEISRRDFYSEYLHKKFQKKFKYLAVLKPQNHEELRSIIMFANEKRIPIFPKGSGNSLSGQLIPEKEGLLLDLSNLNKIQKINLADRNVILECGVKLKDLIEVLKKDGFYFPPSFNNYKNITIGGLIGNNVSNTYRYYTSDYILGLEILLTSGETIKTGSKTLKNVSGYNTTSLFVGSEGSLGIILKAIIKIDPIPKKLRTLLFKTTNINPLINWFKENWYQQELNHVKIIQENFDKSSSFLLIVETNDQNVENLKNSLKDLEFIQTLGIQEYSNYQEEIYSEIFINFEKEKPLVFGFRTKLKNADLFLLKIKEMTNQSNLKIKLDISIINQNMFFILVFYYDSIESMENIIKIRAELIKIINDLGDGLIPDFGFGIWNQNSINSLSKLNFSFIEKIKSAFDPNNILNPKIKNSEEIRDILHLIGDK